MRNFWGMGRSKRTRIHRIRQNFRQILLSTTGYLQTISIIADSSQTAQNYWTALSRPGAHGQCATFGVWVEAFGAKLLFLFYCFRQILLSTTGCLQTQDVYKHSKNSKFEQSKSLDTLIPSCSEYAHSKLLFLLCLKTSCV